MPELLTKTDLLATSQDVQDAFHNFEQSLHDSLERFTLQLTVRFGVMMAIAVAVGAIILRPARHSSSWLNCLF